MPKFINLSRAWTIACDKLRRPICTCIYVSWLVSTVAPSSAKLGPSFCLFLRRFWQSKNAFGVRRSCDDRLFVVGHPTRIQLQEMRISSKLTVRTSSLCYWLYVLRPTRCEIPRLPLCGEIRGHAEKEPSVHQNGPWTTSW